MKAGANVKKVVSKKKVNHYNKAECQSEIARIEATYKNKDSVVVHGFDCSYLEDVKEKLATLA
jgi:esterase/lipase superfamily enzyme